MTGLIEFHASAASARRIVSDGCRATTAPATAASSKCLLSSESSPLRRARASSTRDRAVPSFRNDCLLDDDRLFSNGGGVGTDRWVSMIILVVAIIMPWIIHL